MIKQAFAAVVTLLSASTCFAGDGSYNGRNALQADFTAKATTRTGFCMGCFDGLEEPRYIHSVSQGLRYEATDAQLLDVVVRLQSNDLGTRHNAAAGFVVLAVANASRAGDAA